MRKAPAWNGGAPPIRRAARLVEADPDGGHGVERSMIRFLAALLLLLPLTACGDGGVVADNVGDIPPTEVTEAPTADWSALEPAIGRTPAHSGMLSKGPIVTDLHALVGADAIAYRVRLERDGGPLTRIGRLLVTASEPGEQASYLIVDQDQLALEAGYRKGGQWVVQRTPSTDIVRPPAIEALLSR